MLARRLLVTMLSAGVAVISPAPAHGAESGWPIEAHGFLLGTVSARTTGVRPAGGDGDFVLGEERVRLDLSGAAASGAHQIPISGIPSAGRRRTIPSLSERRRQ